MTRMTRSRLAWRAEGMHVDVEAITRRFDEDLADAEAELRAAQDRVAQAQQRVDELQELRSGFTRAIERYGEAAISAGEEVTAPGEEVTAPADAPKRRSRRSRSKAAPRPSAELSLADAGLAALAEFGRPATTDEIYRAMVESGRQVRVGQVRSSLGYLERRAKRVKRVGRALWELQG